MFDEVKALKIAQLNRQLGEIEAQKRTLRRSIPEIEDQLFQLENEQQRGICGKKHFSLLEKLLTDRKRYQEFKVQKARFDELPRLIEAAQQTLDAAKAEYIEALSSSGLEHEENRLQEQIFAIQRAESLFELGINPAEAVQMLTDQGITPVLNQSDRVVTEHPRDYQDKSSLIAVHKTHFMPTDSQIKSDRDAHATRQKDVMIDGKSFQYSFDVPRETVHMSLNDEVGSHLGGNWDSCQYTVLQPFAAIPNEQIGRATSMDTYTRGSLNLTDEAWILCPLHEVEQVQKQNPHVHVIGYEGENSKDLARPFLSQLGYRAENGNAWGWDDYESEQQFQNVMNQANIKMAAHSFTCDAEDEEVLFRINQAVALAQMLRDEHLIQQPQDVERVVAQLSQQGQGFDRILDCLIGDTEFPNQVEPNSIKGNHRQLDVLFDKFAAAGMAIAPEYQQIFRLRLARSCGQDVTAEAGNMADLLNAPYSSLMNCALSDAVMNGGEVYTVTNAGGEVVYESGGYTELISEPEPEPYLEVRTEPEPEPEKQPEPEPNRDLGDDELILW